MLGIKEETWTVAGGARDIDQSSVCCSVGPEIKHQRDAACFVSIPFSFLPLRSPLVSEFPSVSPSLLEISCWQQQASDSGGFSFSLLTLLVPGGWLLKLASLGEHEIPLSSWAPWVTASLAAPGSGSRGPLQSSNS